ncbi:MAG: hypothetical protein IJS91_02830 [Bacteroidales bacterium]|nr:hypothetical protein [Bacteroidales bacterium]
MPKVLKSYGTQGAVVTNLCPGNDWDFDAQEPVFIAFDELPVPFFIESIQPKGGRTIIKFEDIDTLEAAENLVGREIALSLEEEEDEEEVDLVGRTVRDAATGKAVGKITQWFDFSGNLCIEVEHEGRKAMLPLHEDLIKKVSAEAIWLTIPDGLL